MLHDDHDPGSDDDELIDVSLGRDILVVDDHEMNLVAIEAALAPLGRDLVLASSGIEALARLLERDFALIVLDVMMPGVDGLETARLVRSRQRSRATPIIFVTGLADYESVMLRGYELGAFDFLVKPVRPEVLRAKAMIFLELQERTIALREAQSRMHDRALSRLYDAERTARRAAEEANARASFLSRASALLGTSLDYEETLKNVAELAVPGIADWCGVDLVQADGTLRSVAITHIDPAKRVYVEELRERFQSSSDARTGAANVVRTGEPELYPEITDEQLAASARSPEHLRLVRELGLTSAMVVPIASRGAAIGAISFVLARAERHYSHDDVVMATQLGERAGAAITNAQLYEQATHAIALRDEFVSIAGHELRTPLATMSLAVESLLHLPDDTLLGTVKNRIVKQGKQTDRLVRLVEELLDVTRLASARLELERESVDLAELVRDVASRFSAEATRIHSPLVVEVAPVIGQWDRVRVEQITTNLVSNALKYGKGKPIEISVQQHERDAVLTITDHGIGIEARDHARIFERFERAVSARQFGGLGLGLWIVRQLVEAHGGSIELASAPGDGSTFSVQLPLTADTGAAS